MSDIFNHSYAITLGFHGGCINEGIFEKKTDERQVNLLNILSWIPIIGAIIGAIRIYAGYQLYKTEKTRSTYDQDDLNTGKGMIARGIAECATLGCIGPIMMVVDVIFTFGRACTEE